MQNNILLGRYIPGNSLIHLLDPRAKLLGSILFFLVIFAAKGPQDYALLIAFNLGLITLTQLPLTFVLKSLSSMKWLILFTAIFQLVFIPSGFVLFQWWIIKLTLDGIISALYITIRFLLIINVSTILSLTTNPLMIADSVESMLKPFEKVGVPAHEISLILSIAMRFVPTILDEAQTVMNAQRARGVDFNNGNVLKRIKATIPILVPLFAGALRRADDLANAMEARGYRGGNGRTKYRQLHWQTKDTCVFLVIGLLFGIIWLI
ncbi:MULTISPECIES: energy-coupling factor transporter transmembrane protein EcfT [unclassified Granulicatella]|uniref:energy-coupling factor transporter transmembrane component T family protein n=1 Tax=unclassified Granulicatella TaxID=2630493 RepID=UPI001073EB2B|nr:MULTISPECIES: energy-coupling factor transporter transmembrane component T [unclassified Granulicatella]MBF0780697.1 energy-coupling factor transporter transmembrane protein EcfT [Granulicatella sp. 19428wC4_WM01]TFU94217.1 energy-coupling factor transporter transmembrane protein EcfT [Granulicatella sp. WM01]